MKISYKKINPGGNITALVFEPVDIDRRGQVEKDIRADDSTIEQVGFVVPVRDAANDARLEMAGGELCGNALRCLAYELWRRRGGKGRTEFIIETLGVSEPILTAATKGYAEVALSLRTISITDMLDGKLVRLPGIVQLVLKRAVTQSQAQEMFEVNGLRGESAAGVISITQARDRLQIRPLIWVRDTDTWYNETACASGTMAAAFSWGLTKGEYIEVVQPSGAIFFVREYQGRLILGGPIW